MPEQRRNAPARLSILENIMTTHELKVWPPYYDAIADQIKKFEVRRNDRGFRFGDELELHEWEPAPGIGGSVLPGHGRYTGRSVTRVVSYILSADDSPFEGIAPGYVVLGLELPS